MSRIIKRMTDTDLYKLTMMQAVFHHYTNVRVKYAFKWRNWQQMHLNISLKDFVSRLNEHLDDMCKLSFTDEELNFIASIPFIKQDFVEYLRMFRYNRNYIRAEKVNDSLEIVAEGPWLNTILFEVPVLKLVSTLYTKHNGVQKATWLETGRKNLENKLRYLQTNVHKDSKFGFGDFGTRRCADDEFQEEMIVTNLEERFGKNRLVGTSNVYFAMKYGIPYLGTQAHEWFQAHQQLGVRLIDSQKEALQVWSDEYRGDLGIALSDCITFDAFLVDFDKYFAKLFDGCRHDSGDPYVWCNKLINHYKKLGIDPKTKTALFSDGLNIPTAVDLYNKFYSEINPAFGIGTYLTNDCGFEAPQIVMKLVEVNGLPVAKICDSPGKITCEDQQYLSYLKSIITKKTGNTGFI